MKNMSMVRKSVKRAGILILAGFIIAGIIGTFLWFKPHRSVQAASVFAELSVNDLVKEFTNDASAANSKYLGKDGNSKVLVVEGRISKISGNQDSDVVVILKDVGEKVGVSATFTQGAGETARRFKVGDIVKIKGAITAGNSYDADLDLYEHATLVQCDIVK